MKGITRLIKVVLGIVVVLALVAVVALFFLGPVVKTAVNTVGPKVLGVPVKVMGVSIRPLTGVVSLNGMRVGNPQGYSDTPLFALDEVRFHLDMTSLRGKGPIVIKELTIIEPKIGYEVVKRKSNIHVLTSNLPKSDKPKGQKAKKGEKKEGRRVIIDLLEFRDGEISYRANMTLGQAIPLPLPPLVMTGIGREHGDEGITVTEAVAKVLGELLNVVGTAVANAGTAVLDTGKATIDTGKAVFKTGESAIESGTETVNSLRSAAKELFKATPNEEE